MQRWFFIFFLFICLSLPVIAQEKAIELTGERLTYLGDGEEIIAVNGKLTYQDIILEGQKIHIFLQKKQLEATGNVVVTENKEQFHANQANFNWDTESWEFFDVSSEFTGKSIVGKVFFRGKNLSREPDLTIVNEAFMTSCDLEKPHYHIDAQKIEIIPDKRVILHGISYWDFGFKIFTLPYYVIFLDRKEQLPFIPII
ncbi:MAG: LPS-assembly protein LptD, partial [Candidatus Atribacteria bacterium]|nr:LPS-assembly protein LptD [Candidatus Atribacteria bacterium]